MRLILALAILPVLAVCCGFTPPPNAPDPFQDGAFESPEFGVRLKIPSGWTVGTSAPPFILKLTQAEKDNVTPEFVVTNLAFTEQHITLGQYREQFRQYIQQQFIEPRLIDDRTLTVGGKPAIVLVATLKKGGDSPAVFFKGLVELSPSRLISIESLAPRSLEAAVGKTYDAFLASMEFFARKPPEGTAEGVKRFTETLGKLAATDAAFNRTFEMDYTVGDRNVGSYSQAMKAGTKDGVAGLDVTTIDIIDLGADGRLEKRTTGFLADDLSKQTAEVEIIHRSKERRVQYFTASVSLTGTDAKIDRKINGEKSSATITVPERTVLMELLEPLEYRLLPAGKGPIMAASVLPAFDNEAGTVKIEHTGVHEMKAAEGGLLKVTMLAVAREDGSVITYWYDPDGKMMRRSVGGQGVILQSRK